MCACVLITRVGCVGPLHNGMCMYVHVCVCACSQRDVRVWVGYFHNVICVRVYVGVCMHGSDSGILLCVREYRVVT